jgi:cytochrome P450
MSCPFKQLIEPKGPKGLPLINSALAIALNPLHFFTKIRNKYGNIASYKMFGFVSYLVSHPDDLAIFFKAEKHDIFEKEFFHKALYDYFGNGLLNSYGKDWAIQRKQLKPYFQKNENINKWFPIVVEETLNHTKTISNNAKINGKELVNPIVQAIMCRILFGIKPEINHQRN